MATKQNPIIVDAIEMVLAGASVSAATDFAVQHGMQYALEFYTPQKPEYYEAWMALHREWKRRGEGVSAAGAPVRIPANACEFTC